MKNILTFSSLLLLSTPWMSMGKEKNIIRFATYNVRRQGKEDTEERTWQRRKELVINLIKETIKADILGFQELTEKQRDDIAKELKQHASFGKLRTSTMEGLSLWQRIGSYFGTDESNTIFYNEERCALLDSDTFSINSGYLPHQTGWLPRICTWGLFEDIKTGEKFYVYNTHLSHMSKDARINGIKIILEDVTTRTSKKDYPVILMGDLNAEYDELKDVVEGAEFVNAKNKAEHTSGPKHTSTGWQNDKLRTVDHILIRKSGDKIQIKEYGVVETPGNKHPLSDHRPVYVDVKFRK